MEVFVSSVIGGFKAHRDAAAEGIEMLGHDVVVAERFPAKTATPQRACLAEALSADVVVLLMGRRYGARQQSGLSATHEEYRAVRDDDKVLVFVEETDDREVDQEEFLHEVEQWEHGHFTDHFKTPDELTRLVVRALREYELARAAGPVDEADLIATARAAVRQVDDMSSSLALAVAVGPKQALIRPAELDPQRLGRTIAQEVMFGPDALFDIEGASNPRVQDKRVVIPHAQGRVTIDAAGTILVEQPATPAKVRSGFKPAIEEDVRDRLARALRVTAQILQMIDPTHRATVVAPVVFLSAGIAWVTQEEYDASGNRFSLSLFPRTTTVELTPATRRREALLSDSLRLSEDLMVLLRLELKSRRFYER